MSGMQSHVDTKAQAIARKKMQEFNRKLEQEKKQTEILLVRVLTYS